MEHDGVTTDAPSLSLNLSNILHYLPSGLLARIRRGQSKHSTYLLGVPSQATMTHAIGSLAEQATWAVETNSEATPSPVIDKIRQPGFPSAWAFFTSGYMLGLLVVGFILHRMQNIILPSRTPTRRRRDTVLFFGERDQSLATRFNLLRHIILRRLYSALLPLDITRTTTRLAIQLPSACLLTRMLAIWCLLVLQACGKTPSWDWIQRLGAWCDKKEMSEICWNTFCALGTAFCVEGFIRALDGMSTTFTIGPHSSPNASPFNLIGYSFLLFVYSSPVTHVDRSPSGLPSRPDKHVLITITIPLLQLTIFHYLSISKRLSSHRLIPTTLSSLLSLSHFHMTLYSKFISSTSSAAATATILLASPSTPTLSTAPSATSTHMSSVSQSGLATAQDSSYPLLNYIPNLFETLLLSTIVLTVILNVVVQLLVRGRVDRPFIGLGMINNSGGDSHHANWFAALRNLPWEEDFAVLLLRMSTASLEATGLRGWGNEVAPIPAPLPISFSPRFPRRRRQTTQGHEYGHVRVGKLGVEGLVPARRGATSSALGSMYVRVNEDTGAIVRRRLLKDERKRRKKVLVGYQNEVRSIDVGVNDSEQSTANGQSQGRRERLSIERRWLRAFGTFIRILWGTLQGAFRWLWLTFKNSLRGRRRRVAGGVGVSRKNVLPRITTRASFRIRVDSPEGESDDAEERENYDDMYARFLAGDSFSDDSDDSTFEDSSDGSESESDDATAEEPVTGEGSSRQVGNNEEQPEPDPQASVWDKLKEEAGQLFSDLVDNHVDNDSSTLFAYLTYPRSSGPLTRRRMRSVMKSTQLRDGEESELEDEDEFERVGREMANKKMGTVEEEEDSARHMCVICTVEERDIICWPCRCLAMCDNCRDVLSSRSSPSKHRCPCCRGSVEGYSKIYIP